MLRYNFKKSCEKCYFYIPKSMECRRFLYSFGNTFFFMDSRSCRMDPKKCGFYGRYFKAW